MSSHRDRLRHGLVPLTTSLGPASYHAQLNTPISAVSMASSHLQSAHTPASAIQPYNPQEWMPSPAVASADRVHQLSDSQGMFPWPQLFLHCLSSMLTGMSSVATAASPSV